MSFLYLYVCFKKIDNCIGSLPFMHVDCLILVLRLGIYVFHLLSVGACSTRGFCKPLIIFKYLGLLWMYSMFLMITLYLLIGLPNSIAFIKDNKKYLLNSIEIFIKFDYILCMERLKCYLSIVLIMIYISFHI